ncbi:MAG TPA: hypothetical protein VF216_02425, partial [Mizugakiibacter sp.]
MTMAFLSGGKSSKRRPAAALEAFPAARALGKACALHDRPGARLRALHDRAGDLRRAVRVDRALHMDRPGHQHPLDVPVAPVDVRPMHVHGQEYRRPRLPGPPGDRP